MREERYQKFTKEQQVILELLDTDFEKKKFLKN